MNTNDERRRYPRVSLNHVTVEVYAAGGELANPQFCFTINVSENGMLFKSDLADCVYTPGMMLRLTFVLPDNNIVVRTDAVVVHIHDTELSQYTGVQFKNIDSADTALIREFVANKSATGSWN